MLKPSNNNDTETTTSRFASTLLYNPSTKILKINGNQVVHAGNVTQSTNPVVLTNWNTAYTIATIGGVNINIKTPTNPLQGWDIEVSKASYSITTAWTDSGIDLSTLSNGVCVLHINYENVCYSGTFTYTGQSINTDDEIVLH